MSKTNPTRVRTVTSDTLTHMFLMNERGTLEELASILHGLGAAAETIIRPREATAFASDDELEEFLAWVEDSRKRKIKKDMPDSVRRNLPGLATRIIEDVFKRRRRR